MKNRERESLLKSFGLFFLTLELLLGVIAGLYYHDRQEALADQLFLEMKNYSFFLEGDTFGTAIVSAVPGEESYRLYASDNGDFYLYAAIPLIDDQWLKITAPADQVKPRIEKEQAEAVELFVLASIVAAVLSVLYALYALRPLRQSLHLLEEFLKDIIHDLNTPVAAILVNTRMLRQKHDPEKIRRIEASARTIGRLHGNLQSYLREEPLALEKRDVAPLAAERTAYYAGLYPGLRFETELEPCEAAISPEAMERVLDNLLSNAAKYNRRDGFVRVTIRENILRVEDGGTGIREPKRVFDRFYKESDRGLGIGLHIVKKLCDAMGIGIELTSSDKGTVFQLTLR